MPASFVGSRRIAYDGGFSRTRSVPSNQPRTFGSSMELSNEIRRIQSFPEDYPFALEILVEQAQYVDLDGFLGYALARIAEHLLANYVAVVDAQQGHWRTLGAYGELTESLPASLLGDSLDSEEVRLQAPWLAAPLQVRPATGELLVARFQAEIPDVTRLRFDMLAATIGTSVKRLLTRHRNQRRLQRLEAILEIAGQWNQNLETEPLLCQMAETSTRLLGAERASIFIWDRPQQLLVGRPALGVDDGELRIPDDEGIVGQVVQTGEVRRVDRDDTQNVINREVDQQLGFETQTLLCVPLRGRKGKILGAFEMINKQDGNFSPEDESGLVELAGHAAIALENSQHITQLLESRKQIAQQAADSVQLIGETPAVQKLRDSVQRVAATDLALLILGENGTGKEVVSQMVHYLSKRRDEPFIAVNCAALTETLLESELFGHEKGAFTDAHEPRAGKFELASGGTLFLDEIGDLSLSGQAKLLRVLEEKVVVRVGGSIPIPTDTRVVAATNQNLGEMVRDRRFREDLFFRLNVVTVQMPPLRERVDDIVLLADYFLHDFCLRAGRRPPVLTEVAIKRLRQHAWPGNVRELRNLMERLAFLTQGDRIDVEDLAFIISPGRTGEMSPISLELSLADATKQFQADYISKHIESTGGNMSDAARRLGLHRSNLYRKMRQLDMSTDEDDES
ncbi:MAG: sigma-54-dependent Fis family transcriptional regulator [Planctomycetaceae bacterium]|nr:sigma-54-dependent Fis family transcriptional regulator [Planctomycetaceae bacterium]